MSSTLRQKYEDLLKNPNVVATLNTLGKCEGATYNTMFGGGKFSSYADHPRRKICSGSLCSDASGKYQFLSTTWDETRAALSLSDFSPRNQDIGAVYLMDTSGALPYVLRGDIVKASEVGLSYKWASLPPFRYPGQGTCDVNKLKEVFAQNKGVPLESGDIQTNAESNTPGSTTPTSAVESIFTSGKNCPPPPFNIKDRITYPGCKSKILSAAFGAFGNAYPGPATNILQNSPNNPLSASPSFKPVPGGFINPAPGSTATSEVGWRWGRYHAGIDLADIEDSPILASGDGKVVTNQWLSGYGNTVDIQHSNGLITRYAHLSKSLTTINAVVKQGQVIGLMGETGGGNITGVHLHFEIRNSVYGQGADYVINPRTMVRDLPPPRR